MATRIDDFGRFYQAGAGMRESGQGLGQAHQQQLRLGMRVQKAAACRKGDAGTVVPPHAIDSNDGRHVPKASVQSNGMGAQAPNGKLIQNKGPGHAGSHGPVCTGIDQASVLDFSTLRPR